MGNQDLGKVLHFKYLGRLQSGDGDPIVPIIFIALVTFRNLTRTIFDKKLPLTLRLCLFCSSVVPLLLYRCESWKLTETVLKKLNGSCSTMLSQITGKSIVEEAHAPLISAIARPQDRRWLWLGHILCMAGHQLERQVLLQCVCRPKDSIFGDSLNMDMILEIFTSQL